MAARVVLTMLVAAAAAVASAQLNCRVTNVVGCYTDDLDGMTRTFPWGPVTLNQPLTQEGCANYCSLFNFTMAAVEFGTQCFCGNSFNPAANSTQVDITECSGNPCPGNKAEPCGASNRMLIFNYACAGVRYPNGQACVTPSSKSLPFCDMSLSIDQRLTDLQSRLSLSERVAMISPQPLLGDTCATHTADVERLGVPQWMWLTETNTAVASACMGPGVCATTFNGPMGMGASFNTTSWYLKGSVVGTEMRAFSNAQWHRGNPGDQIGFTGYGPNINNPRDPRFGRTSELPSEDPLHAGTYAKYYVQGMQEEDANGYPKMMAYLKHFTAYSRETDRGHDTYNISMHDLWETYLAQYEIAFTQGLPAGAMCSYNGINGHPSCANDYILNTVVRGMWNQTNAHITTDCGAVNNLLGPPVQAPNAATAAAMALNNGTDIEMGSTVWTSSLVPAVLKGLTTEAAVNASWRRSYRVLFRGGRFDDPGRVSWTRIGVDVINSTLHQQIQYEAALQSFVLLKNDNNMLPLPTGKSIAVIGPMGMTRSGLLSDYAGDQQCWEPDNGCIMTLAEGITAYNNLHGGQTASAQGVDVNSNDTSGIAAAVAMAQAADIVVLIMGIDKSVEHEGQDRTDTALPGEQPTLVSQVLALGKPTVLVLSNGGVLAIDDFMAGPAAIVEVFNPSVKGAQALAATLFGVENRWGKMPVTMYPHVYIQQQSMTNYDMALAPGRTYRYYQNTPLFPYGHGLSYTTFQLSCAASGSTSHTCTVQNTGVRHGDEVVLVYHSAGADVRAKANHPVPLRSLVAFERVRLAPGESTQVTFTLGNTQALLVNENGVKVLYSGQHEFIVSRGPGLKQDDDVVIPYVVA